MVFLWVYFSKVNTGVSEKLGKYRKSRRGVQEIRDLSQVKA